MVSIISGRPARTLLNRGTETTLRLETQGILPPDHPTAYDAGKRLHAAAMERGRTRFRCPMDWSGVEWRDHCRRKSSCKCSRENCFRLCHERRKHGLEACTAHYALSTSSPFNGQAPRRECPQAALLFAVQLLTTAAGDGKVRGIRT